MRVVCWPIKPVRECRATNRCRCSAHICKAHPTSGSTGSSYSLNTTRAAVPLGRGRRSNFHRCRAGAARRGEIGGEAAAHALRMLALALSSLLYRSHRHDVFHEIEDGGPAGLVEFMLQRKARAVGSRCRSCAPESSCAHRRAVSFRQCARKLVTGQLPHGKSPSKGSSVKSGAWCWKERRRPLAVGKVSACAQT